MIKKYHRCIAPGASIPKLMAMEITGAAHLLVFARACFAIKIFGAPHLHLCSGTPGYWNQSLYANIPFDRLYNKVVQCGVAAVIFIETAPRREQGRCSAPEISTYSKCLMSSKKLKRYFSSYSTANLFRISMYSSLNVFFR